MLRKKKAIRFIGGAMILRKIWPLDLVVVVGEWSGKGEGGGRGGGSRGKRRGWGILSQLVT